MNYSKLCNIGGSNSELTLIENKFMRFDRHFLHPNPNHLFTSVVITIKVLFLIELSSSKTFALASLLSRWIVSRSDRSLPSAFHVATVSKPLSLNSRTSMMTDDRTPKLSNSTFPVNPLYFVYK